MRRPGFLSVGPARPRHGAPGLLCRAMRRVSVAASSPTSAAAGADLANAGGNAVDAALASAFVSLACEPGLVAIGGSGFVTVCPPDGPPVVIDAYAEMPGRGVIDERRGSAGIEAQMDYGGGLRTVVGYGSVATPGALAGLAAASERYGAAPWAEVVAPTIRLAEEGFPLPAASAEYLFYSGDPVFGWHPESRALLLTENGRAPAAGTLLRSPELAESLRMIAAEGAQCFYTGELGRRLAAEVEGNGGLLTLADLAAYEAIVREPVQIELDGWDVVTNPPPALGGAALAAMLLLLDSERFSSWDEGGVVEMAQVQRAVLSYRKGRLEEAPDRGAAVGELLDLAQLGDYRRLLSSPSTIHVSAVDTDGLACSITMSAGYGSGAMISGTGIYLNNSLGELELHPLGFHGMTPGTRLPSNMAPTVARRGSGTVMAIGSPGADRITTALCQTLANFIHLGMSLHEAVEHPRLHVEMFEGVPTLAYEPGLRVPAVPGLVNRRFPDVSMYFGGVQAVLWDRSAGLFEAADPRRTGGVARGGR